MSESISVFIKKNISILEIKSCLEEILNCRLEKVSDADWEIYSISLFGLRISLLEAEDFDDDQGIKFSEFNFYLDVDYIRGEVDIDYAFEWRLMASIILGNMIFKKLNCECFVIKNMQHLIASFTLET